MPIELGERGLVSEETVSDAVSVAGVAGICSDEELNKCKKVSFKNCLQWAISKINSVDKTKSSCNASFWHLHVLMGESIIIQLMGIISYDIVGLKGNRAKENKSLNFSLVVYSLSNIIIIDYSLLIFQCSPFILNCNILIAYW